ncbi:AAA family ATPase [Protofrankia symbiont of Coriaria ruscifolia]|uniref:AAA family ATPase n=1 Tax=Protofrankia symbiont of Coriaria ruscifolia TaxID=1306542 RepID=UPI001041816B|nr:ATP-binding protein [Protofrankia symbiont of Coriaria ruscifolia]
MLLRFRVANHRSIRDEAELSLVSSSLQTINPRDGDWAGATTRVTAIYGANAAGKSNLLDAVDFAVDAVRHSATTWAENKSFPFRPFRLTDADNRSPSFYELSVVVDDIRYDYGFRCTAQGVHNEWLYSYPEGRRRQLFVRNGPGKDSISFSRNLPGDNALTASLLRPRSLYLSVAANANHELLQRIQHRIAYHILYAKYSEMDRLARLRMVMEAVEDPGALEQAVALLKMADVGITNVAVKDDELPRALRSLIERILDNGDDGKERHSQEAVQNFTKNLSFLHSAANGKEFELSQSDESSGTLAWIALAVPALRAFRHRDVLLVDELDASIHPYLASALVEMFKNPAINSTGAQIIFTTHDVAFMNPSFPASLKPDEVWFTEKKSDGATELYSLAEYPTRRTENFSKRYLDGRYGAVPLVDLDALVGVLHQDKA